jgi:hypothetical protein
MIASVVLRTLAWTEAKFCKVFMRQNLSIARSHIRNDKWPLSHRLFAQQPVPRSNRKSSTLLSDSGNRTYIITARRMISSEELK